MTKKTNDTEITKSRHVHCDGGSGAEGHPKIYLEIAQTESEIICPYCSKKFVLKE